MTPEIKRNGRELLGLFPGNRGFNKQVRKAEVPLAAAGPRKKVYALYSRRSSEQDNASIERQIIRGTAYVFDRFKADVSYCYDDEGVSGEIVYRPGLDQMLADAEAGLFNVLVVEAVDRLGRKVGLVTNLYERLIELGIEVHSVAQGDEVGEMDLTINALLAAQHQKLLRQRIGLGKMLAVQKKMIITTLPFGYMRHPHIARQYIVDEALRPTIEWIYEQRANGLMGLDLARGAKAMCPKPELLPRNPYAIVSLVQNPIYKGLYIFGRERARMDERGRTRRTCAPIDMWQWFEADYLRIVSPELWTQANETIAGRERRPAVTRPLNGKIICATCGMPMVTRGARGAGQYGCGPRAGTTYEPLQRECTMQAVNVCQAQEVVFGFIRQMLMDDALERAFESQVGIEFDRLKADANARREVLEARRKKIGHTLERAMDNALIQNFPPDLVLARQRELSAEWESLGEELRRLPDAKSFPRIDPKHRATLRETVDRFEAKLATHASFTPEELTALGEIRKLVKELRVYPIAGSRSVKLVATLDLGKAYGQARLPDGLDCAERKYERILHRLPARLRPSVIEQSFAAGDHFLTDQELKALVDRFGEKLSTLKEANILGVRTILNFGIFLGSTSITEDKFDHMKITGDYALLKHSAAKISKFIGWASIFQRLEELFPDRRGTLNYDCWETWVFFVTARQRASG